MADPLTIRYNNPGAIEYKPFLAKYGATVGPNGRYAQFPDVASGYNAMEGLLNTYQTKHGLNTVEGIVNRWAPPNVDNNSTSTYSMKVAQRLGVDPKAPLDPSMTPKLAEAMAAYEAGRPVPRDAQSSPAPQTPQGAPAPMAAPALTPYDGPSPDDVAMQRKLAMSLMQQGTSTEPVGHWTQALARVLQGGVGGMYQDQARQGEKQGRQYTADALTAAMQPGADPTTAISNMLRGPYSAEAGQKLAGSVIESNLSPSYDFKAAGDNLYRTNRKTGQATVIDGNIKQTGEVQKLISEADTNIANHRGAINTLDEMLRLNKEAYDGPTASTRAMVMGAVGDKAAQTTQYIENMTKSQALSQLRAIFGGNPTEGERKVLLDVAGSVNQPADVREKVWQNARSAVAAKMAIEAQKAEQLRNNSYFKPGGGAAAQTTPIGPQGALPPQAAPQPQPQAVPGVSVGQGPKPLPSGSYIWTPDAGTQPAAPQQPQQQAQQAVPVPQPMQRGPGGAASYRGAVMPDAAMPPPPEMRRMTPQEAAALRAQGLNEYGIPIRGIR